MSAKLTVLLLVLGSAAVPSLAQARVEAGSGYTKTQTFSCALRFLRVERGYEIVEKDGDAAYVLFRYPIPGQKAQANGSLEVIETASGVKVFVELPKLPEYHETLLRDALLRKLREEYGAPPPKPPSKPEPVNPPAKAPAKPDAPKSDDD